MTTITSLSVWYDNSIIDIKTAMICSHFQTAGHHIYLNNAEQKLFILNKNFLYKINAIYSNESMSMSMSVNGMEWNRIEWNETKTEQKMIYLPIRLFTKQACLEEAWK